jgi:hypothetical protein
MENMNQDATNIAIKETPAVLNKKISFFYIFAYSNCDDPRFGCKRLSVFLNISIHINVFILCFILLWHICSVLFYR